MEDKEPIIVHGQLVAADGVRSQGIRSNGSILLLVYSSLSIRGSQDVSTMDFCTRGSLSHSSLGWLYVFSSFLRPPLPQWLLFLMSKPFELDLRYLRQRKYGSGKMYWVTFGWPWPKVRAVTLINKNLLVCRIKWEPLNQSLQNLAISFWSWSSPDYILEEFCWIPFFLPNFLWKFREWLVRLMWNEKEVHLLDTGWTMWSWPLTSPMTLTFDFSRLNSEELLSDWCETKRKQIS